MEQRVKLKSTQEKINDIRSSQEESMSDIFSLQENKTFTKDTVQEKNGVSLWGKSKQKK